MEATRVEVIDETGRVYVNSSCKAKLSFQDNNQTLKVFIKQEEQQYPIFKRNEDGEVFIVDNESGNCKCVLSNDSEEIGYKYFNEECINLKTIPYDKDRGLYHLQPAWCSSGNIKAISFYDYNNTKAFGMSSGYILEPITTKQLKTMPFIWSMYKELLKDNQ